MIVPLYSSPRFLAGRDELLPTIGPHVCDWIEANCVCGEGDWYGEAAQLRDFQADFIDRLYEYYPQTMRRRYRRALLGIPKGNGKTPLAAWIGAHELACDECEFAARSPRVIVGAASLKQANLVFGDLKVTFKESPTLADLVSVYDLQILLRDRVGLAERIAAEAGTNDGARGTCFISDELHEWIGQVARLFMIVDGAIAKRRNAFTLGITTAGILNEESLLWGLYQHLKRVAAGELVDDSFLGVWYEAPDVFDLEDHSQLEAAIYAANPAAGDFCDVDSLKYRFHTMPRHEFVRYHLNRFNRHEEIWDVAGVWDALESDEQLQGDRPLYVGIDLGLKHDSSAVEVAQVIDGRVVVRSWIWENPYEATDPRHGTWKFSIGQVKALLRLLYDWFRVPARETAEGDLLPGPAFFYDPMFFEDSAQELALEGLNMLEYPQNPARMVAASQRFFQLAITGAIAHDGDASLARHIRNVVPDETGRGWRISKPKGSRTHIDGAVAVAIACYEATRVDESEGEPDVFGFDLDELGLDEDDDAAVEGD